MISNFLPRQGLLGIKISLPFVFITLITAILLTYWGTQLVNKVDKPVVQESIASVDPTVKMTRKQQFGLTKPILLFDLTQESASLLPLKEEISSVISQKISSGEINRGSVYVRSLNNATWISVNKEELYNPGSLAKIAILITILKQEELHPGFLSTTVALSGNEQINSVQEFKDEDLIVGKKYTIRQLLDFMITKSSNKATFLLTKSFDDNIFKELFTDIGLPSPVNTDANYKFNVDGISRLMRLLYNSTYINAEDSEYALRLLSKVDFNEGITSVIPKNITVAHKFGEQGDSTSKQLHETAIVYQGNNPYLLTIMTQGKEMKPLPGVIREITTIVNKHFVSE